MEYKADVMFHINWNDFLDQKQNDPINGFSDMLKTACRCERRCPLWLYIRKLLPHIISAKPHAITSLSSICLPLGRKAALVAAIIMKLWYDVIAIVIRCQSKTFRTLILNLVVKWLMHTLSFIRWKACKNTITTCLEAFVCLYYSWQKCHQNHCL